MLENKSVSHATHRPQDIIPAFLEELALLAPDRAYHVRINYDFPCEMPEDSDLFWTHTDVVYLMEDLFDELDILSPEGFYFGAHPGDGSDFGFWECEDV